MNSSILFLSAAHNAREAAIYFFPDFVKPSVCLSRASHALEGERGCSAARTHTQYTIQQREPLLCFNFFG